MTEFSSLGHLTQFYLDAIFQIKKSDALFREAIGEESGAVEKKFSSTDTEITTSEAIGEESPRCREKNFKY